MKRIFNILFAVIILALAASPAGSVFALTPSNGQAATLVLGQPNFTSGGSAITQGGMHYADAVAVDLTTHKVFVADVGNNRVLRFASLYALNNGALAEAVLGQPNFTSAAAHTTQTGMNSPWGVFVDSSGSLWVGDEYNDRVLRFDHASTLASGAPANAVLGQPNFTSNTAQTTQNGMDEPVGVFGDASGRIWVADYVNSRVLRFDNAAAKSNGANADGELGQPNFTSNVTVTTQSGMTYPFSMTVDSGGRLWVTDTDNNRILRFDNAASKGNGANADGVLGQPNFTSNGFATTQNGMNVPEGVAVDNSTGRLYVSDRENNRILVFNSAASLGNGADASNVLGQTSFTTSGYSASATTLSGPTGLFFDPTAKVLLATDYYNSRALVYGTATHFYPTSTGADDGWVLESAAGSGKGGSLNAAGSLNVGDNSSNRQSRSILSFATANLPDNAVIHSVTLKIKKQGFTGMDPLTSGALGFLVADIKKGTFGTTALEAADFQAVASASAVGSFSSIGGGWYQLVVPAGDFADINLTGPTQFRLRFAKSSNLNHSADYDSFYSGDASSVSNRPVLVIYYSLP
jgi:sugar lactone lactonase YvrE